MKTSKLQPRPTRFNRFQTSIPGLTYVHTCMDAHFDPDAEPAAKPRLSAEQMERVARIEIPATANGRSTQTAGR